MRTLHFPKEDLHFYEDYRCPPTPWTDRLFCMPPRIVVQLRSITIAEAPLAWADRFGESGDEFFARVMKYITKQGADDAI